MFFSPSLEGERCKIPPGNNPHDAPRAAAAEIKIQQGAQLASEFNHPV